MSENVDVLDVLKAVDKAFKNKLIDCSDRVSVEKRLEVIQLRKLVKRAIDEAEIDEAVSRHYEPVFEEYR